MQNIMIFENNQVEVFELNGQVLFNPYDVGRCLELTESAVRMAIKEMNERQVIKLTNSDVNNIDTRKLNNAGENFLTESGVYKLIFKSRKPNAEKFQDWVTDEVLPSIRKTGAYLTPQKIEEVLLNPDTIIKLATDLKEEQEKNKTLTLINKQQNQIINELQPKATYYDLILQCPDLLSITQIAKDFGMSGTTLNKKLNELGIQYKHRDTWLLYAKYADKGYTQSTTHDYPDSKGIMHSRLQTNWTQKGRLFIYEKLKRVGILPTMEKKFRKSS